MAEFIDKKAAIAEIKRIYCTDCQNYNGAKCRTCDFQNAVDVLEDMPKADVAPGRRGRWIEIETPHIERVFECSLCKWQAWGVHDKTPYCPGCGAKIDLGGDADG